MFLTCRQSSTSCSMLSISCKNSGRHQNECEWVFSWNAIASLYSGSYMGVGGGIAIATAYTPRVSIWQTCTRLSVGECTRTIHTIGFRQIRIRIDAQQIRGQRGWRWRISHLFPITPDPFRMHAFLSNATRIEGCELESDAEVWWTRWASSRQTLTTFAFTLRKMNKGSSQNLISLQLRLWHRKHTC